ncbi:hypothetical protein Ciccas_009865, partial [Cichlidogyrus casuarinus]
MCLPGWQGIRCDTDIDECEAPELNRCQHFCKNTLGGHECYCRAGYDLQSDGRSCELPLSPYCDGGCLNGGTCLMGSTCSCLPGFRGNRCEQQVDFCAELKPCDHLCFNNAGGGYRCACREGFELDYDAKTCRPIQNCTSQCLNNGRCYGGRCSCAPGYKGESCESDINECELHQTHHKCEHQCVNTPGDYECICPPEKSRLADKKTCV